MRAKETKVTTLLPCETTSRSPCSAIFFHKVYPVKYLVSSLRVCGEIELYCEFFEKYPPGTFWSHGGYFLNKPSKKSHRVAQAHYECITRWFLKETEGFFHKVSARYFLMWIVKGIKGFACNSTNIYPLGSWWVLSECTHLNDRQVPGWVLCKNTQHVPSGYLGGQSVGKMWN